MSTENDLLPQPEKKIVVRNNGPYRVKGGIPLVRKTQVVSELGEPLTWKLEGVIETAEGEYELCRCGLSANFPFCDDTHKRVPFDGSEDASIRTTAQRQLTLTGSTGIIVKKDPPLCMFSGFCAMDKATFNQIVESTADTKMRSLVIAMIERCPSGSLTYHFEDGEPDIEPDLPQQIAVTVEITAEGPIHGPLWVTGYIPVERADGRPFETRNRVTLCNCGKSNQKPLCDGTHRSDPDRLIKKEKSI